MTQHQPRCTCGHTFRRHLQPITESDRCPCGRCHGYTPRPTAWRIRQVPRPPAAAIVITFAEAALQGRWEVISPRGDVITTCPTITAAHSLASHYAGIDELLARVHRLERNAFGDHPALKASARNRPNRRTALEVIR